MFLEFINAKQRILSAPGRWACLSATVLALLFPSTVIGQEIPEGHRRCTVVRTVIEAPVAEAPSAPSGGSPLVIDATFDASVTDEYRVVIDQAIAEWETAIVEADYIQNPLPVSFKFEPINPLGVASVSGNGLGKVLKVNIRFDSDTNWFVDPTPADDSEFGVGGKGGPAGFDLLSVARHEIGHGVGFMGSSIVWNETEDGVFDAGGVHIEMTESKGHCLASAFPGDLMNPSIGAGTRRWISGYPNLALLASAYGHDVAVNFIDDSATGTQDGSLDHPWDHILDGPSYWPTVVFPGSYPNSGGSIFNGHRQFEAVHGGTVIVN
jgi:hypothetical protein